MSIGTSISDPAFNPLAHHPDLAAPSASNAPDSLFWGDDGLRFDDLLDTINPLHHIPVVGNIYRAMTGDDIAPGARLAGGALFGGPLGFISSLVNTAVESATGRDISGHMLALVPDGASEAPAVADAAATAPQLAAAEAPTATPTVEAPQKADRTTGMAALAALQRDLIATRASSARPSEGADALAALRRDLLSGTGDRQAPAATPHHVAANLPDRASPDDGPVRADGRKPGEYSAAELASIYRSYQRAAEAAAEKASTPRVEE